MLQEALKKLQTESGGSKKKYVPVIGKFLMEHIRANPDHAPLILTEGKTIEGSIKAMEAEARKPECGGMLSDEDGYRVVLKYFGVKVKAPEAEPVAVGFSVDLDELL